MNTASHNDADLILKLYDLRREAVMRQAREFIFQFASRSIEDAMAVAMASGKENAYVRQVYGYWDMAASLVLRGALDRDLAFDNFQEMFFVYARIKPFLAELRTRLSMPDMLIHVEKLVNSSPEWRDRVALTQHRQAEWARLRAAAAAGKF